MKGTKTRLIRVSSQFIKLRIKSKATVLFSTHILSDVEAVCDSVTVVDNGRSLYGGTVDGISSSTGQSFEDAVLALLRPTGNAK